jgi:hypothetical protein
MQVAHTHCLALLLFGSVLLACNLAAACWLPLGEVQTAHCCAAHA